MSKFNGILEQEEQVLIHSIFSQLSASERDKMNIIESIENIVYVHPNYFEKLTEEQREIAYITLATVIDSLLDEEVNPLAKRLICKAFDAYNNNIFEVVLGRNRHV